MGNRLRLYLHKGAYNHQNTDPLFLQAVRDNAAFHLRHSREYQEIAEMSGFRPEQLTDISELHRLPVLPTLYYKRNTILTMKENRLPIKATSSGTSGSRSQIGYNCLGLFYGALMTWKLAAYHSLLSARPAHYILLGQEPHFSDSSIITKTQHITTLFAPPKSRTYTLKYGSNGYQPDYEGVLKALNECARSRHPVRLVGIPAYALFLLTELKKSGLSYQLPEGSMVLLGGGWKGFYRDKVEKEVLFSGFEEILGIPAKNCREFFGAAEHPGLYCTCANHHFHVPDYSRVLIRDVKNLAPVPNGEIGLLNLISPLADSMPLISVLTDDLACLHDGQQCGCGIETPYFDIIGRTGVKGVKTCAVSAEDMLKGVN